MDLCDSVCQETERERRNEGRSVSLIPAEMLFINRLKEELYKKGVSRSHYKICGGNRKVILYKAGSKRQKHPYLDGMMMIAN